MNISPSLESNNEDIVLKVKETENIKKYLHNNQIDDLKIRIREYEHENKILKIWFIILMILLLISILIIFSLILIALIYFNKIHSL